ncbi:glycosyltransferase family 2 protein [Yoonia ponticola]|uniref:glycosyltransferase family 2 protein n=1 Tax=Yoonia ponticola TaxID=1524255 RepID=UPI00161E2858|nr:glycosyltransferase family 2 protein [Yoonia ponticola]
MSVWSSYRLRLKRKRFKVRARRKSRELRALANRTSEIRPNDILLFCTMRNEDVRIPYFLRYYRELGVDHFIFVDNGSNDGGAEYLAKQPDVSIWSTTASYKKSRFGLDWLTYLQMRYADDHWTLTVDVDEFFVFPFCDTRPVRALTDWLDSSNIRSFGAMMLDMYPKGKVTDTPYQRDTNPLDIAPWFDAGNYTISRNDQFRNLWIQGGPRARVFFADRPKSAPALNKVPLVKWSSDYTYVSSTHMLLPRGLNLVYDEWGGEKASGVLLHMKFLDTLGAKAAEELSRGEHYAGSAEYAAYAEGLKTSPELWCKWSEKYINWRQLEILGIMSKGNWA